MKDKERIVYDSSTEFFEATASREKFKSNRLLEFILDFSTDMSNRKAADRLNRIRLETQGISPTTYRNIVEREGQKIQECIKTKCEEVLILHGFNANGELPDNSEFKPDESRHIEQDDIINATDELNVKVFKLSDYESPEDTVNISLDDVCVKRQSDTRPKEEADQPKRVYNTVAHVQNAKNSYILNSSSVLSALKLLIGLLLYCGLLKRQLVFFTDGARELHNAIHKMFFFANYKIILDWYHLKKKCQEQLSMALKGSKIRNDFLEKLLPCLWFGNINGAILLLQNIEPDKVKNPGIILKLIEYLERVRGYVPCYAIRKKLGLRNSSNIGEKSNDLIVSARQKHNGMSWSSDGSGAFASVAAASYNQQIHEWVHDHTLSMKLAA